ncbi:MAG TPA: carboxypeptidase regulatory-like domain-containing protein, partial [Symbiobacteriaceae bacterium]|nr:carboxypeptidase regulatory-like domain-containing protein [Symbiobacteriaceae bacterium]
KTDAGFEVVGIQLFLINSDGQTLAETTTGAGGTYRFEGLPSGTYTVKVKSVETPLTQATKVVLGTGESTLDLVIPATVTLTLVADPSTIVGNGRALSQLKAEVRFLDNEAPVDGVEVIFATTAGTFTATDASTSAEGKANATLKAPLIGGLDKVEEYASVRVQDVQRGLFAYAQIKITFAPSSIDGVVLDNGSPRKPIEGAVVHIHKVFDDGSVFDAEVVTGADGRYSIIVPKGNTTYEAEITTPVTVGGVRIEITTKQTATVGEVSGTGDVTQATKTISGQLFAPDPTNGGVKTIDQVLTSGQQVVGTLFTTEGAVVPATVTVDTNGAFRAENVPSGTYVAVFQVRAPDGQLLAGVRVPFTVSADGELTIGTGLIDPFGTVTSAATGLAIAGVTMELRWADTPLNIGKGRTPGALVALPELATFLPNKNHVPQLTTATGEYAWMVFPDGDYYIVATKSGYLNYDSRTEGRNVSVKPGEDSYVTNGIIHVGTSIVQYDLQMQEVPAAPPVTPPA